MMTSLFKKMTVALALVGALGAASATPVTPNVVYLGTLDRTLDYVREFSGVQQDFDDVLSFKAADTGGFASILSIDVTDGLTGFYRFGVGSSFETVSWYKDTKTILSSGGEFMTDYILDFPTLKQGETYWFEIAGSMTEGTIITMIQQSQPQQVPEPGSMALVLAGMGAVGVIARRRKTSATKMGA